MLEPYIHSYLNENESVEISRSLLNQFKKRRTIRDFKTDKFNKEIILNAIQIAGLAPNGANKQPWSFVLIESSEMKSRIRNESEKHEYDFYNIKKPKKWLNDLKHLHTDENKFFLTDAPYLIPVFSKSYEKVNSEIKGNYYVKESVGIAVGFLISALHQSGISTLTYTPSKMNFLKSMLNRPEEEKLFMLIAVGLPKTGTMVPTITKKPLDQILTEYHGVLS